MKTRLCSRLLFCFSCLSLAATGFASSTALVVNGRPGTVVGNVGRDLYATLDDGIFTATRDAVNQIIITTDVDLGWTLTFVAPNYGVLAPGTYPDTRRYADATHPGLKLIVEGFTLSPNGGTFAVKEVTYDTAGQVLSFDATFTFRRPSQSPVEGEVMYHADSPLPPRVRILGDRTIHATEGQPLRYRIWASGTNSYYIATDPITNTFAAEDLPDGLSVDPATGIISGRPALRGTYEFTVFSTNTFGTASEVLTLIVDPPWRSTGPFTAFFFRDDDPGEWVGGGRTGQYLPIDANFYFSPDGDPSTYLQLIVYLDNAVGFPYLSWSVPLGSPLSTQSLPPGYYPDVRSYPSDDLPWFDITGDGRGCGGESGEVTVRENAVDSMGRRHFSASFLQTNCSGNPYPLKGKVWFEALQAITSYPLSVATKGEPYSFQIVANNDPTSFTASGLPAGLSINRTTGIISGTPQVTGIFIVGVSAAGTGGTASDTLQLMLMPPEHLKNISTRGLVRADPDALIGGFIVKGTFNLQQPKTVLVRAIGPSLAGAGIQNPLPNPFLELRDSTGALIAQNKDWKDTILEGRITSDQSAAIDETQLAPDNELEAAILVTLDPGAYTAIVRGDAGSTGSALVEIYDLDPAVGSRLANISTRAYVGKDEDVMIGGFIVGGADVQGGRILIDARGPSLAPFVPNTLPDPTLAIHDANGTTILFNHNWTDTQKEEISATDVFLYAGDAGIIAILSPGAYTAVVEDPVSYHTGLALLEVYHLDLP